MSVTIKKTTKPIKLPHRVVIRAGILELGGQQAGKRTLDKDTGESHLEASGDLTVAELATSHEFGLGVPERSFLRGFYDLTIADVRRLITAQFRPGVDPLVAGELCALKIEAAMKNFINDKVNLEPNAQSTQDRKHSDVPLVDTGVLRSSITAHAEVVR